MQLKIERHLKNEKMRKLFIKGDLIDACLRRLIGGRWSDEA